MSRYSSNPYVIPGFLDGFERGLNIVYTQQDRKTAADDRKLSLEDRERRIAAESVAAEREGKRFDMEQTKFNTELERAEYEKSVRATPEEVKEDRNIGLRYKRSLANQADASAAKDMEDVHISRDRRNAAKAKAELDRLTIYAPHLADLADTDPNWLDQAAEIDAFVNGGLVNPKNPNFAQTTLSWLDKTYSPDVKKGIGEVIHKDTAKLQKVPEGSKIINKRIKNIMFTDPDNAVLELEVEVMGPDGKLYKYDAPVTKDRSSAPDAEVLEIPITKFKQIAKGAGYVSQAAKQMKMDPRSKPGDIKAAIEAALYTYTAGKSGGSKDDWVKIAPNKIMNKRTSEIKEFEDTISMDQFLRTSGSIYQTELRELGEEGATVQGASKKTRELVKGAKGEDEDVPTPKRIVYDRAGNMVTK